MKDALVIENLRIEYPISKKESKVAVENLSMKIFNGEFFGLLGPNGAGKTSVISAITGLVGAASGKIEIFGHPAGSKAAKRLIGFVPQELIGYGFFTVTEVLRFYSGYFGVTNNESYMQETMLRLQLTEHAHKLVSQLSGGMKRRLLIAKALLHRPKILLLDEPSAGVDVELRQILWEFMVDLNRQGTTILLTTHYLEEAQRLCKRVAIVNHGKLLAMDATGEIIGSLSNRMIRMTLNDPAWMPVLTEDSKKVRVVKREGLELLLAVESKTNLQQIVQQLNLPLEKIQDLTVEEGSLESAFLKLVKQGVRANG